MHLWIFTTLQFMSIAARLSLQKLHKKTILHKQNIINRIISVNNVSSGATCVIYNLRMCDSQSLSRLNTYSHLTCDITKAPHDPSQDSMGHKALPWKPV